MARSADISLRDGAHFQGKFEVEVNGMRSWSAVQRHRVITERLKKTMEEDELLRAEQHLARQLKLMALPEWARRFL
jgi:acid stress-induced BolA-like protein IbaG/YrbA